MLEFKPHSKVHSKFYSFTILICPIFSTIKIKVAFKSCVHWALVVLSNRCALRLPQAVEVKNTRGNKNRGLTGLSSHLLWAWAVGACVFDRYQEQEKFYLPSAHIPVSFLICCYLNHIFHNVFSHVFFIIILITIMLTHYLKLCF